MNAKVNLFVREKVNENFIIVDGTAQRKHPSPIPLVCVAHVVLIEREKNIQPNVLRRDKMYSMRQTSPSVRIVLCCCYVFSLIPRRTLTLL